MEKNEQPVQAMEPMFHQLIVMSPPTVVGGKTNIQVIDPGITIRDHFAASSLVAFGPAPHGYGVPYSEVAKAAYLLADAMMLERAKWKGGVRC
jgi:hypothetical protein